jgi:signal peptidase II
VKFVVKSLFLFITQMLETLKKFKLRLASIGLAAVLVALDQWSKSAVKAFLEKKPDNIFTLVKNHIDIVYRHNTGGAFSMLDDKPSLFLYLPTVLIVVVLVALFSMKERRGETAPIIGLGFILGGAVGNMFDRIREGKVFDFIDCYAGNAHWPAFNVADSCIVAGVCLFALSMLLGEIRKEKKPRTRTGADAANESG